MRSLMLGLLATAGAILVAPVAQSVAAENITHVSSEARDSYAYSHRRHYRGHRYHRRGNASNANRRHVDNPRSYGKPDRP